MQLEDSLQLWYLQPSFKTLKLYIFISRQRTDELKGENPWLCPKVSTTLLGHNPEVSTTTTTINGIEFCLNVYFGCKKRVEPNRFLRMIVEHNSEISQQ